MKRILIGVCGGTGSGKTTIARKIIETVGAHQVVYLQQDSYYRDLGDLPLASRHQINFDHPDSVDFTLLIEHVKLLLAGNAIEQPGYDFATHTRTGEFHSLAACPIILLDGILIFAQAALRELMNIKIFVDTDADIRFIRRLQRDINERGRTIDSVIHQYMETVRPMHAQLVEPSRVYADIIIPEGGNHQLAIEILAAWIKSLPLKGELA
jgi:uridine kinase